MNLSSDELEILEYLKSWKGASVSLMEISRCASGRKRFREEPNWAKGMMSRLVEANLIQVNERGHYSYVMPPEAAGQTSLSTAATNAKPAVPRHGVVGEDYFPAADKPEEPQDQTNFWIAPQMLELLKQARRKMEFGESDS